MTTRHHLLPPTLRPSLASLLTISLLVAWMLTACGSRPALLLYLEANRAKLHEAGSETYRQVRFVVEPGAPARAIAQELEAAGLIDDALLFEAYVRAEGLAGQLEAGAFILSPDMTPVEIAEALQHARAPSIAVTIPPGWRLEQTADYLGAFGSLDGTAYGQWAASGDLGDLDPARYSFLDFRPAGASLEGYLFPDTYELSLESASTADLLRRQLDNFAQQVMPLYWEAVAQGDTQLELHDALTLASIVEREAVIDDERPIIAGVYLNRLASGMRLEADPTVQYALGYQPDSGRWWKVPIFLEEYGQVDSPYNTYLNAGLPPGPIASPGLSSIQAVLQPAEHDYLFFVARPDRSRRHVFSRTFEEHLQNVRRFQAGN